MWDVRPEKGRLYVATFQPATKKKLDPSVEELIGKDLYVTPLFEISETKFAGQWAFQSNETRLMILERDLIFIKEITEPLEQDDTEETTPDQGEE